MLRSSGGTISAKTGLLQAGAAAAMQRPMKNSRTAYRATTKGSVPSMGRHCLHTSLSSHCCSLANTVMSASAMVRVNHSLQTRGRAQHLAHACIREADSEILEIPES